MTAAPDRRHRHVWQHTKFVYADGSTIPVSTEWECARCGAIQDPIRSTRGRTNRSRGNAIERQVAARLGLRRVGQFGGADDIRGLTFVGQVKSGGSFPERLWTWLRAVPVTHAETRILVMTDAPGPGHPRRALVILELEDWVALHGAGGAGEGGAG